jgi:hypothetical protein
MDLTSSTIFASAFGRQPRSPTSTVLTAIPAMTRPSPLESSDISPLTRPGWSISTVRQTHWPHRHRSPVAGNAFRTRSRIPTPCARRPTWGRLPAAPTLPQHVNLRLRALLILNGRGRNNCGRGLPSWSSFSTGQFRPAIIPPSTLRIAPVIQSACGDNRKMIAFAMSIGVPTRPSGWRGANVASVASMSSFGMKPS